MCSLIEREPKAKRKISDTYPLCGIMCSLIERKPKAKRKISDTYPLCGIIE